MILRARHVFIAWLAYGALQLALLGVPGAATQPGIGAAGARSQSESQSVEFGKRVVVSDFAHRRAPTSPFTPSAQVRLDLPALARHTAVVASQYQAHAGQPRVLPPARAPPTVG